jgi:hypothetical protein
MDEFQFIEDLVARFEHLGQRKLPNGTRLIAPAPHVAPEAWLHKIYTPLSNSELGELESELAIAIPPAYRQFLKYANGLKLFSDSLSLDGYGHDYSRTDDSREQPYSLVTANAFERPRDARERYFFIGGYSRDGSRLYMDVDSLSVCRCSRKSTRPLNEWWNFSEMLSSECERLAALFDESGKKKLPVPTTPPEPATGKG